MFGKRVRFVKQQQKLNYTSFHNFETKRFLTTLTYANLYSILHNTKPTVLLIGENSEVKSQLSNIVKRSSGRLEMAVVENDPELHRRLHTQSLPEVQIWKSGRSIYSEPAISTVREPLLKLLQTLSWNVNV